MISLKPGAHVHLIGIAGTAMGALAGLLQQNGYHVTGSDTEIYPPISTQLAEMRIPVCEGYRPENLTPQPALVIVGNAISRGNPELEAVLDLKLPYASLPEILRELFLAQRETIAIAGTHGKTTTTAMTVMALREAGVDLTFAIGAEVEALGTNAAYGTGEVAVVEADESDGAFLVYTPRIGVITNVDADHLDH